MGGMVATLTVIRHQEMWKVGDFPHTFAVLQPLPWTFHPDTHCYGTNLKSMC